MSYYFTFTISNHAIFLLYISGYSKTLIVFANQTICNEIFTFLASLIGISYQKPVYKFDCQNHGVKLEKVLGQGESERERIFAHARLHLKMIVAPLSQTCAHFNPSWTS